MGTFSPWSHGRGYSAPWKALVLFVTLLCVLTAAQDFGRHGLFWGGSLNRNSRINENGVWQNIPGASLHMKLDSDQSTFINYELAAEGLRKLPGSPLPRESNTDSLQVRCVIDGSPLRHSSSSATTYLVEQRMLFTLSSSFVVNMTADNHTIALQWKKTGNQLDEWILQTSGAGSKFTISAQADFDAVSVLHETRDEFLYTPDVWKPLSNNLTFFVDKVRTVTLGYSFNVQPQLVTFVKDRAMDYIMSRLSVDGTAFIESGETFGTNGWNPSSHVMSGTVRLKLAAGHHVAQLQWRKRGNIFKSWSSNPSSLDGFASARNLYVLLEKFDPPTFVDHERHLSPTNGQWTTVGGTANMLTFSLVKESAVLLTYALPVSQYENPKFDANVWDPLAALDARLVVDDVAYNFVGGDALRLGSRQFANLFGSLALVLPAGTHVAYLQWRSDGFRWTTLNDMDGGFAHGEKILAYVTSENAAPAITAPEVVYGTEDVVLVIPNVRIDDVDALLAGGVVLDVNLTTSTGMLGLPNAALLANPVQYEFGVDGITIRMTDTIANINAALLNLTFTSPANWNGEDFIQISISDKSHTGFGSAPLNDSAVIRVVIAAVDDMFLLDVTASQTLPNVGAEQPLAPIGLSDIDSQSVDFRAQLSATCGTVSLPVENTSGMTFFLGDGTNDTAVDFQANFLAVQELLQKVAYSPSSSCNQAVHQESVVLRVTNSFNPSHDLTRTILIDTVRENTAPEILSVGQPRWSLRGLRVVPTADTADATVQYTQYPAAIASEQDWLQDVATASNLAETSALSELSVFTTPDATFALSVQYGAPLTATLSGSSYILPNVPKQVTVAIADGVPQDSAVAVCAFGTVVKAAVIAGDRRTVKCNVTHTASREVEWLKVVLFAANETVIAETNYLPLFATATPTITSAHPRHVLPAGQTIVRVSATATGTVDVCLFNDASVPALLDSSEVVCEVPVLSDAQAGSVVKLALASADRYIKSSPVDLTVLAVPVISSAKLATSEFTHAKVVVVEGQWSAEAANSAALRCVLGSESLVEEVIVSGTTVFCSLRTGVTLDEVTQVSLLFDHQATNSVPVAAAQPVAEPLVSETEIYDISAGTEQGDFLTLIGDFRNLTTKTTCTFGLQSTVAVLVDDFTALCPIPPGSSGGLWLNDEKVLDDFAAAQGTVAVPMVSAVTPASGSLHGGETVTVTGAGFVAAVEIVCRFGSALVPGLFLSERSVQCVAPPHAVGAVRVDVIAGDVYSFAAVPVTYVYSPTPQVASVHPAAGPLAGGTNVVVRCSDLPEVVHKVTCKFDDVAVTGVMNSASEIACVSPASAIAGSVSLSVTLDDSREVLGSARYLYLGPMSLSSVFPASGSLTGGNRVLLQGVGFSIDANTRCVFGHSAVEARVFNGTHLDCIAPTASQAGVVPLTLDVDGNTAMVPSALTYSFVAVLTVTEMYPMYGSPQGGTRVTLRGSGFTNVVKYACAFDSVEVPASYLSDTELVCTAPAHSAGTVTVVLRTPGYDAASVEVAGGFLYVVSPTVERVMPAAGPVAGGAVVAVAGSGFSQSLKDIPGWVVHCQFGEKLVVAAVQSDTALTCLTPPADRAETVELKVVVDGLQETSAVPLLFRYIDAVDITAVTPADGSTSGGDLVTLHGIGIPLAASLACTFGDHAVPATVVNDSAVLCVTPTQMAPGPAAVSLSIDGYIVPHDDLHFTFFDGIVIADIYPSIGSVYGGTNVTVRGSGFRMEATLVCLWDDVPEPALFVSSSEVVCVAPAHALGNATVTVIETGTSAAEENTHVFAFTSQPTISSIKPTAGWVDSEAVVEITGAGFPTAGTAPLSCVFGTSEVAAEILSAEKVTCRTPSGAAPGVVSVRLALADNQFADGILSFRYLSASTVTAVSPRQIATGKSQTITLGVTALPVGAPAECVVGNTVVPARILSEASAQCEVFSPVAGAFPIALSVDGLALSTTDGLAVMFVEPPIVSDMDPTMGPTTGGTNVTLSVTGIDASASVECLFGTASVAGTVITDGKFLCSAPPRGPGTVTVGLVVDGVAAEWTAPRTFTYGNKVRVTSISPAAGSVRGGQAVTVSSSGLLSNGGDSYCRFGGSVVTAAVLSDNTAECVAPPVGEAGLVEFAYIAADGDESSGALFFRFVDEVVLTVVDPAFGSVRGGDVVVMRGVSIPESDDLWCHFGSAQRVKATKVSETAVECATPAGEAGDIAVSLALGDAVITTRALTFTYSGNAEVASVNPTVVSVSGGSKLTWNGSGLNPSGVALCWFGDASVPANIVSPSLAECFAPAHVAGTVEVTLSVNGVLAESQHLMQVEFIAAPLLLTASPSTGGLLGGTKVVVAGNGFSKIPAATLKCAFGSTHVPATVVSDAAIECTTPAASTAGQVAILLVSDHQTISSGVVSFRYVAPVVLESVTPQYAMAGSAQSVMVRGTNFVPLRNVECQFGGLSTAARVIDHSTIECATPAEAAVADVELLVVADDVEPAGALAFTFIAPWTVTDLFPREAGSNGGDKVMIHGTGFAPNVPFECHFGDTFVVGVYVDETTLSCVTTTHAADTVPFVLRVAGAAVSTAKPLEFTFVSSATVLAVSPAAGALVSGSSVWISGRDLTNLTCRFADMVVETIMADSTSAMCTVPVIAGDIGAILVLELQCGGKPCFTAEYTHAAPVAQHAAAYPRVIPVGQSATVRVSGGVFFPTLSYMCSVGMVHGAATVLSETELSCELPPVAVVGSTELVVAESHLGLVAPLPLIVAVQPVITTAIASRVNDAVIIVSASDLTKDIIWNCEVDGVIYEALLEDDGVVHCGASGDNVALSAVDTALRSNTMPVQHAGDAFAIVDGSPTNGECSQAAGLSAFRNDDAASFSTSCVQGGNKTFSDTERRVIDQKAWFKTYVSEPPRDMSASEFDYSSVGDIRSPDAPQPYAGLFVDAAASSCAIDRNNTCFSVTDSDVPDAALLTSMVADNTTETIASADARQLSVLHAVEPSVVDSVNGTWITLTGRGFVADSVCIVDNTTTLLTTYISSTSLQCFVRGLDESQHLFLSISVADGRGVRSANTLPVVYDFLSTRQRKSFAPLTVQSLDGPSNRLGMAGGLLCASKLGCSVNAPAVVSNVTWVMYQDAVNFGVQNLSLSTNYSTSNELRLRREEILASLNNQSASAVAADGSADDGMLAMAHIFVASPSAFDLSQNSSDAVVTFLGSGLGPMDDWCMAAAGRKIECYVQSATSLVCAFPQGLPPGELRVQVLRDCSESDIVYDGSIRLFFSGTQTMAALVAKTSTMDVLTWREGRTVLGLKPLSGGVDGMTAVRIIGPGLESAESCTFRLDALTSVSAPVEEADSTGATCLTPAAPRSASAAVEVNLAQGAVLDIGVYFTFFNEPEVNFASTGVGLDDDVVSVYGQRFPTTVQSFCKFTYTSGQTALTGATTMSDSLLTCMGTLRDIFHGRVLKSVAVSFNGQDFIEADSSTLLTMTDVDAAVDMRDAAIATIEDVFSAGARQAYVANALSVNAVKLTYTCDASNSIILNVRNAKQDVQSECHLDGTRIGVAQYLSAGQMRCTMPSMPPGDYELSIQHPAQSRMLPSVVAVQCLPAPKILAAEVRPISQPSGSTEFAFSGLYIHPTMILRCRLGNEWKLATVDSAYQATCMFAAIEPGVKAISLELNGRSLMSYTACLSVNMLSKGGPLLHQPDAVCSAEDLQRPIAVPVYKRPPILREIRSFSPRSGLTTGSTAVEIIADGIDFASVLSCKFGDQLVDALVVDMGRVVCYSPPLSPQNVTLSVVSADGQQTWCCGWFYYHPVVKALSISPTVIDRAGGTIILLELQTALPATERVYCHVNSQVLFASRVGNNSVSCVSPTIQVATKVNVSVGSQTEIWSNIMTVDVSESWSASRIVPARGSLGGGTLVKVAVSPSVRLFSMPNCLFGEHSAAAAMWGEDHLTLECVTPAADVGTVDVVVVDAAADNSAEFYAGQYTFEVPATISTILPTFVNQGEGGDITVFGANFYDSPSFACVLNGVVMVPAKWLSAQIAMCHVDAEHTIAGQDVTLQMTNNQVDLSEAVASLQVKDDNMIRSVYPLTGFVTGGTEVSVQFRADYQGTLRCRFDGRELVAAFQMDTTTYSCATPRAEAGVVSLEVVDAGGFVLAVKSFTYYKVPVITAHTVPAVLSETVSELHLPGEPLAPVVTGRLRNSEGGLIPGSCNVEAPSTLNCTGIVAPANASFLFLDVSANGLDFVENIISVQVFNPSNVVLVDPLFASEAGGNLLRFTVDTFRSGFPTTCRFTVAGAVLDASAVLTGETTAACVTPSLPLGSVVTWSILQAHRPIYGPVEVVVVNMPTVTAVTPLALPVGILTAVEVTFLSAVYNFPAVSCVFQGVPYALKRTAANVGTCTVLPTRLGASELRVSFRFDGLRDVSMPINTLQVIDQTVDVTVVNENIVSFTPTEVTLRSEMCSLPSGVYCRGLDTPVTTASASPCEVICHFPLTQNKDTIRLDLCATELCLQPLFSTPVNVMGSMSIVALSPASGPVQGGQQILLHGTGFEHDSSLLCRFGKATSSLTVLSPTRAQCTTPPNEPGVHPLHIERRGRIVTTSIVTYQYIPLLSRLEVSPRAISSLGGSEVTVTTQALQGTGPYSCRFADKFVPALVLDDSTVMCMSPSFDLPTVTFALARDRSDISEELVLDVWQPPAVYLVEPEHFPADMEVMLSVYLEDGSDSSTIQCLLDGTKITTTTGEGSVLMCTVPPTTLAGEHTLSLQLGGIEFFTLQVLARPGYAVRSVSPMVSFATVPTAVTLTVTEHMTGAEFSRCCFGDVQTPATLLSSTEWRCYTPIMRFADLDQTHAVPVGLAREEGFCEYFGFEFTFHNIPQAVSAVPRNGSVAGGTPITLTFPHPVELDTVYCRVGLAVTLGQVVDNTVRCVTSPTPVGESSIELSTNGEDFAPTAHKFLFLPITPAEEAVALPVVQPVLYFIEPTAVSTISQSVITVRGEGFRPGITCLLGQVDPVPLLTTLITEGEAQCILPVHVPGHDSISVRNIGSEPTAPAVISFVADPSLNSFPQKTLEPAFGPRRAETFITIYGQNLRSTGSDLLCLIGEEWVYAVNVTDNSLQCLVPPSQYSGSVIVRVARGDQIFIAGSGLFQYIEDPLLFDVQPAKATRGTDLLVTGVGFLRSPELTCMLGDKAVTTTVLSNTQIICQVPELSAGQYSVTLNTNGQHYVRSGLSIQFAEQVALEYLWPLNGPSLRGGTMLSVHGRGFVDNIDVYCMVDVTLVPAVYLSETEVQCRLPPHRPGMVNVSLIADGALLHPLDQNLQFLYVPDVSVDKITPEFGYTSGDYPVFVFGSNFINTTSLGCRFADMKSRGLFLSPVSIVCLSPSPLGRPLLANLDAIPVEVTVNGLDYSESGILFAYSEPCDQGFFCAGSGRSLCPNGTYCPKNSRNFTLCAPGYFQPREGQTGCVICPVGYLCPDQGMSRPINCPPGLICDSMGLRSSTKLCPAGHYCLNNTKSSTVQDFEGKAEWLKDYVTGVVYFNESSTRYDYKKWPYPAVGQSRPSHPPDKQCDGLVCSGGTTNVLAEAPFPCPIGHYCRAGVGTQIPMPKNFSSPQRCYDGFFCPRGSVSPEGQGPCPNGYFCPTQLDAIICPQGHYCPGVGNTAPVECYPGTYNPFEGQGNCTVCPTGHICPSWGTLLPEPCPAGFVCMALGLSYPVVLCPAGYRCAEGTLTMDPSATTKKKPVVCKDAEFCLGGVASTLNIEWISTQPYGATQPQVCSEGTYCQAGAYLSSGSGLCFKGHYCPPNTSFPFQTPLGNFASNLGSVAPTLCYPGTYAPLEAQVDCLTCPSGHTCISYGTFIPTICLEGTYRSQVDSVTCTVCPTGTYSYEVGGTDLTVCLPCPKGRICGIKKMVNLKQSTECPPGYICGYGTDRSSQFAHLTPAGFHTVPNTIPEDQYSSPCQPGFYCPRGTPTYSQFAGKCPVGSYCPLATPAAVNADTKCPKYTTSLSQAETVQSCRIAEVNVCDKLLIDDTEPMEDITYYATFEYDLLDDSGLKIQFDSSVSATNPTGEIQVVRKIHPTNLTSSSPQWLNDTVEAYRTCPQYGSAEGGDKIIVVGRNFLDNKLNYCRFRACYSANLGRHPRRCQNQITLPTGEDMRRAGNVSDSTIVVRAKYLSPTRIECEVPEFVFDIEDINYSPDPAVTGYACHYVDYRGNLQANATYGNYSYVRQCDKAALTCADKPQKGYEYFSSLTFRCTATDIFDGVCAHKPELNYMFNPCMSAEVMVEVTNDGEHYSGGTDLEPYSILSTVRFLEHDKRIYNNFKNFTFLSTFAVYTYVFPTYVYKNPQIMDMERAYCVLPRYSEEAYREREDGYFQLKLQEVAHVQVDLSHLPDNLVYDQHYRIAIFIVPSRCTVELCSASRVRLSPEEFVPCRKPKEFSYWFQQTDVPKNVKNNITIFALDDMVFKVEIHILHGLYAAYAPLFTNTTTVRIASPQRTRTDTGATLKGTPTRQLSKYISFEERKVPMQYFYVAVYYHDDVNFISQALNMPPTYKQYERGRALIMNNRSSLNNEVPTILDQYDDVNVGTSFWLMPATTSDQSKEMLDAYFETFHETTWGKTDGYVFLLEQLALPYLPYFSNCDTFDSYIPIWLLLEGDECQLPVIYPKSWIRYKFPALPDIDDVKVVGPFSFFEDPIADWCERTVKCHYEEKLTGQDNTPRWFEAETGTSLFQIIRTPFNYYQYTGRPKTGVGQSDAGGGAAITALQIESGDNFIAVTVDHSVGDLIPGCTVQCFARSYLLEITYFQETLHTKRIVSASLIGDLYDFDQERTDYELQVSYYALGFLDLVLNFAFDLSIFMVIFVFLGFLTVFVSFIGWGICRMTTLLQNPPQIKIMSMLVLIVPPPLAGVTMGVTGIWLLTSLGNWFINGEFVTDPNSPELQPIGTQRLDEYPLEYGSLETVISTQEQETARTGRIGSVFMIVGFCCFIAASKMYFPKDETKREHEVAELRTDLAKKELWDPVMWKKANFMFCSFVWSTLLVLVVEFSFSDIFAEFVYVVIVMLIILGEVFKFPLEWQLSDAILTAPLNCGWNFISQLVTFGSPDFLAFLLSYFLGVAMQIFQRVFQKVYLDAIFAVFQAVADVAVAAVKRFMPKYLNPGGKAGKKASESLDSKDYRRREVDGVQEAAEESDSVEPILDYFSDVCSDLMVLFYFPYFVYLLMQYREQIQIPILYGIRQSDMMIYLVFQLFVLFFQPFADIFHHSMCELFHGWKIYEYLVYSRYRFLQRETRWKSMENSLDECIEESLRRLDQMCFSSQYYLMLTVQVNGIIYVVLAYECWLRSQYSPFSDSAFFMLLAFLVAMFLILKWLALWLAIRLKLWKIKHENTAWHMAQREEDELDIPAWEEIKGASTDAYLMNQRITSETFRYKFLNYNRTWLINQLPQLLTPRTLRRSRPYLINQFARIINARRDDISDDSDDDKDKKFGPVALTAPSRNIVRWWLGKARRRIKLRTVVDPLIKRARGAQCEQCLSRKQLQIEYEVDIDKMAEMYDNTYPGDEEVDQVQWKQFWINNQRYHTICLACLTRRKEIEAREALKGAVDPSLFDDGQEEYPDWGPVFLTAASKAMLLNWYRKAQRLRAGKRGNKKKEKVIKTISDDEGEDLPKEWLRDMPEITAATKAIAIKWMRTARARLQKKHGKGAGLREADKEAEEAGAAGETFRSGRKSRTLRK